MHVGSVEVNPVIAAANRLRQCTLDMVYRFWPDPEASLLASIQVGMEKGIPVDLADSFRDTGTAHIIAISGYNISVIMGRLAGLFGRALGRWRGTAAAVAGVWLYTLMVGAEAPVARAVLMGTLAVAGAQIGRSGNIFNSLAFGAALIALVDDPRCIFQLSFQLSFLATLGMALFADGWAAKVEALALRKLPEGVVRKVLPAFTEYFLVTLAA